MTTPRRTMKWVQAETNIVALASGGVTNMLLFNSAVFGGAHVKGATVTRIITNLVFRSESLAQLNRAYWGITMVNADARAAGAFPDPDDMNDRASWLVRDKVENQMTAQDTSQWSRVQLDLRAQRVFRNEEEELHFLVTNAATGFTIQWGAFIRVLLKLP